MWVEKGYKGTYNLCERYIDHLTGKTRKASITIQKDSKQAIKASEGVLRAKIEALTSRTRESEMKMKELSELFLIHQKRTVRNQSYRRDKFIIPIVTDLIGKDVLVNKLSARHISRQLDNTGKDNVTLNTYMEAIRKMLKWGYRNDYIDDISFLSKLKPYMDKGKKERIEDKYLSSDELKKVLDAMKSTRWKLLTEFLALSGLRIGEALALLDTDVTDVIVVNKTADTNTFIVTDSAKTDAGNREVYIQPELKETVDKIRAFIRKESFKVGYRSKLFFPYSNGEPLKYNAYRKYLKEYTLKITGKKLTPHALRHTHVSLLAEQGVPLEVISRRIGHDDSKVTRQIYLHITERQKEKDKQLLSGVRIL